MAFLRNTLAVVSLAVVALACGPAPRSTPTPASAPSRVVGYLASWGVRLKGTRIAELPGGELTHIIYAFARVTDDDRVALGDPCLDTGECNPNGPARSTEGGNFAELRKLK